MLSKSPSCGKPYLAPQFQRTSHTKYKGGLGKLHANKSYWDGRNAARYAVIDWQFQLSVYCERKRVWKPTKYKGYKLDIFRTSVLRTRSRSPHRISTQIKDNQRAIVVIKPSYSEFDHRFCKSFHLYQPKLALYLKKRFGKSSALLIKFNWELITTNYKI